MPAGGVKRYIFCVLGSSLAKTTCPAFGITLAAGVKPKVALRITGDALAAGRKTTSPRHVEIRDLACLGVNPSNRAIHARGRISKPNVAVQVRLRIVNATIPVQRGRRAQRPITPVVRGIFPVLARRNVVLRDDNPGRIPSRTRAHFDFHFTGARSAHPGKIGCQLFLLVVDNFVGRFVRTHINTVDRYALHQIQHRGPAGLIKSVLQNIIGLMATGAIVPEDLLHAAVIRSVFGKRREQLISRKLLDEILHRLQREVLMLGAVEIDLAVSRFKTVSLGPRRDICRIERGGE